MSAAEPQWCLLRGTVTSPNGLHMRDAMKLFATCRDFRTNLSIQRAPMDGEVETTTVAESLVTCLLLGLQCGEQALVRISSTDSIQLTNCAKALMRHWDGLQIVADSFPPTRKSTHNQSANPS